jgi:nuclear pore complex protein Nup88
MGQIFVFILFSDGSIFVLYPIVPFGSDYIKKYMEILMYLD